MKYILFITYLLLPLSTFAYEKLPAVPADAKVYFIEPKDGDVIQGPVTVKMGLIGMGVAPSGVVKENTGHHHLIINAATPNSGVPIKKDEQHRHFGGGQTEAVIDLVPGEHTLQLVIGDFAHRPHDPAVVSEKITITVE